ncbi:MAG: hypothetical protein ACI89J_004258, partial [Hyphomicrobiaceae bacterium]
VSLTRSDDLSEDDDWDDAAALILPRCALVFWGMH